MSDRGRCSVHAAFGGAMIAMVAGACGSHDCASAGYQSYVGIRVPTRLWSIEEFCVDGQCVPASGAVYGESFVSVKDEPDEYTFRLRVVKPDGEEFIRKGTVATKPYRGNGPGCDPLTAGAVVRVSEDGRVTVGPP